MAALRPPDHAAYALRRREYASVCVSREAEACGRGHTRALLMRACAVLRRAGLRTAELSVHGANAGALRLYEPAGMRPAWQAERWEKPLGLR